MTLREAFPTLPAYNRALVRRAAGFLGPLQQEAGPPALLPATMTTVDAASGRAFDAATGAAVMFEAAGLSPADRAAALAAMVALYCAEAGADQAATRLGVVAQLAGVALAEVLPLGPAAAMTLRALVAEDLAPALQGIPA